MPDHTVYWHQPDSALVDAWEFQFQRLGSNEWEWVLSISPVDGCECFAATISVPEDALLVRSRSVNADGASEWSNRLPIYLTEPSFVSSIALCVLAFVLARSFRSIAASMFSLI